MNSDYYLIQGIHNKLIGTLITGHVGYDKNSNTYVNWKTTFTKYCREPTQRDCEIISNFRYLEDKNLISPGKYDVLLDLFSADNLAESRIKAAARKINGMASSGGQLEESEEIPFTLINVEIINLPIAREMTAIITELIRDFKDIAPEQSPIQIGYETTRNDGQASSNAVFVRRIETAIQKFENILRNKDLVPMYRELRNFFKSWFQMLYDLEKEPKMPVFMVGWQNSLKILVKKQNPRINEEPVKDGIKRKFQDILTDIGYGSAEVRSVRTKQLTFKEAEKLMDVLN